MIVRNILKFRSLLRKNTPRFCYMREENNTILEELNRKELIPISKDSIYIFGIENSYDVKHSSNFYHLLKAFTSKDTEEIERILSLEDKFEITDNLVVPFINNVTDFLREKSPKIASIAIHKNLNSIFEQIFVEKFLTKATLLPTIFTLQSKVINVIKVYNTTFKFSKIINSYIPYFEKCCEEKVFTIFKIVRTLQNIIKGEIPSAYIPDLVSIIRNYILTNIDLFYNADKPLYSEVSCLLSSFHIYLTTEEKTSLLDFLTSSDSLPILYFDVYYDVVKFANYEPELGYKYVYLLEKMIVNELSSNLSENNRLNSELIKAISVRSLQFKITPEFSKVIYSYIKRFFKYVVDNNVSGQYIIEYIVHFFNWPFFNFKQRNYIQELFFNHLFYELKDLNYYKYCFEIFNLRINNKIDPSMVPFFEKITEKIVKDLKVTQNTKKQQVNLIPFHFLFFRSDRNSEFMRVDLTLISPMYDIILSFLNFIETPSLTKYHFLLRFYPFLLPLSKNLDEKEVSDLICDKRIPILEIFRHYIDQSTQKDMVGKYLSIFEDETSMIDHILSQIFSGQYKYKILFSFFMMLTTYIREKSIEHTFFYLIKHHQFLKDINDPEKFDLIIRTFYLAYIKNNYRGSINCEWWDKNQIFIYDFFIKRSKVMATHPVYGIIFNPEIRNQFFYEEYLLRNPKDQILDPNIDQMNLSNYLNSNFDCQSFKDFKKILLSLSEEKNVKKIINKLSQFVKVKEFIESEYFVSLLYRLNTLKFSKETEKKLKVVIVFCYYKLVNEKKYLSPRVYEQLLLTFIKFKIRLEGFDLTQVPFGYLSYQRINLLHFILGHFFTFKSSNLNKAKTSSVANLLMVVSNISKFLEFKKVSVNKKLKQFCHKGYVLESNIKSEKEHFVKSFELLKDFKMNDLEFDLKSFNDILVVIQRFSISWNLGNTINLLENLDDGYQGSEVYMKFKEYFGQTLGWKLEPDCSRYPLVFFNHKRKLIFLPVNLSFRRSKFYIQLVVLLFSKTHSGYRLYPIDVDTCSQDLGNENLLSMFHYAPDWMFADDIEYTDYT